LLPDLILSAKRLRERHCEEASWIQPELSWTF
jgi:hypothetical protein